MLERATHVAFFLLVCIVLDKTFLSLNREIQIFIVSGLMALYIWKGGI